MEKVRSYEGLFIIVPEKLDNLDEVKANIKDIISDNSGNIVKETDIGKKTLAYPIKKKEEGIYYEIHFSAKPASVAKMSRLFRINNDLLRALIDKS
ncbi:MAG: 30S ribosomal protein S6 [Candidatus Aadella gelida]|nr:30S ribosomal protein S6 [Candidatus Aadella gelida]